VPATLPATVPAGCQIDWNATLPAFTKYNPPIEISVPFGTDYSFMLAGEEITNNPTYNRLLDNLGIKYNVAWQADANDVYTRLNNDMAAGTMPDAFRVKNSKLAGYIDQGAIENIKAIWEATASPLTKQKKGYPDSLIWLDVTRPDGIYGIAYNEDKYYTDSLLYIRQDWLDKVGMAAPTTLDEITAVAKAFKSAGLCEFPIAGCQNLVTWQWSLDAVFGAFGVIPAGTQPGFWIKNTDGSLRYASLDDGAKQALTVLNTWFNEGLINPDFINLDESGPNDAFLAGTVGIGWQPWWGAHANVVDLYAAFPDAKIAIISNPKGPNGKSGRAETTTKGAAILFRKGVDPKKVEAVINHINWQVEMHANWEKFQQYGEAFMGAAFFRGYEWDLDADCNMVAGPLRFTEWMYGRDLIGGYRGCTYPEWQADVYAALGAWTKQDQSKLNMAQKFILSDSSTMLDVEFYNDAIASKDEIISNAFKGANTTAISDVLSGLLDLERSEFLGFITGGRSLNEFDAFKKEWLDAGGQVFTDEVNKWAKG
jgi:putative aldouronate transport system substrate-binding protein